ncbi:hypothetical protein ACGF5O_29510 [Streptomyces sp. NPDC048291]|uniref:hypothetical protein n=1 Tax=Streptomyces sp. NPDC048291 TaxID=3365530 RepID=UPI003723713E
MFEQVLDRALGLAPVAEAIDRCAGPLGREELRDRAVRARGAILAFADIEYRAYREALAAAGEGGRATVGAPEPAADGVAAKPKPSVPSVLMCRVPAVIGLVFLLSGFAVRSYGGRPYVGGGLVTVGLLAAAVAVGAAVGDLLWLSVTAARGHSGGARDVLPDVGRARRAWELALLERGMVPFLLGRLEEARMGERGDRAAR